MASTPFKVVSWAPLDPVDVDKLQAMVSNDAWLRDNQARARYAANGVTRDEGIKILSGLILIPSGKGNSKTKNVSFGSYFSEGCKPIVTTGIVSGTQRKIFVTVDGPGKVMQPQRDGMQVHVVVNSTNAKMKITHNFYVSYVAIGF